MKAIELKKHLDGPPLPVYFITGYDAQAKSEQPDLFLQRFAVSSFTSLVDEDMADFNLAVFDNLDDISSVLEACNTPPFMVDRKVVVVKECFKVLQQNKTLLEQYVKEPSDFCTLALVCDNSLSSLFKYGVEVNCAKGNPKNFDDKAFAVRWVRDRAARVGCSIGDAAIAELIALTTLDMGRLESEMQKLTAYCSGGIIAVSDVDALVSPDTEFQTTKLTNAIADGKNDDVFFMLNALLVRGERPSVILSMLISQYGRMFHSALSKASDAEMAKQLGVKEYAVTVARKNAKTYTQMQLKTILDKLVSLDYGFKSGKMTEREALDYAVAYLLKKKS